MKRLLVLAAALALGSPALAQEPAAAESSAPTFTIEQQSYAFGVAGARDMMQFAASLHLDPAAMEWGISDTLLSRESPLTKEQQLKAALQFQKKMGEMRQRSRGGRGGGQQPAATPAEPAPPVAPEPPSGPEGLQTPEQKQSYFAGTQAAKELVQQVEALKLNPADVQRGLSDFILTKPMEMEHDQMTLALRPLEDAMRERGRERRRGMGRRAQEESKALLESNAKAEGVKVLPSGLQYKEIVKGSGTSPKASDRVRVFYKGTTIQGEEIESNFGGAEPAVLEVQNAIPGWVEALQLMSPGSKWELVIPSELAYGEKGVERAVPPNAAVKFEIELVEVL